MFTEMCKKLSKYVTANNCDCTKTFKKEIIYKARKNKLKNKFKKIEFSKRLNNVRQHIIEDLKMLSGRKMFLL